MNEFFNLVQCFFTIKQLLLIRYRYTTLKLLQSSINARRHGGERKEDASSELEDIKTGLTEYQQCIGLLKNRTFSSSWVCNSINLLRM